MSVLVDTSVWIRFLANKHPYAELLTDLLVKGQVFGHELVFGELFIGDPGGRRHLLISYSDLYFARGLAHSEVLEFVRHRKLYGRGIGWIDAHILASAIVGDHFVWTADKRFHTLARELRIAYDTGDLD